MSHSKLSPSGSSRWLNCPGSVAAVADLQDKTSWYAAEGSVAHLLAERWFKKGIDPESAIGQHFKQDGYDIQVNVEMARCVQGYINYVESLKLPDSIFLSERKVYATSINELVKGTCDNIVFSPSIKTLDVVDLKFGRGHTVEVENNTQLLSYAVGAFELFEPLYDIRHVRMHIYQPRHQDYDRPAESMQEISVENLRAFAKYASNRAVLALLDGAPRIPGETQCMWCPAKVSCREYASWMTTSASLNKLPESIAKDEGIEDLDLSESEMREIVKHEKLITTWIGEIKEHLLGRLQEGEEIEGLDVIPGRSVTQWKEGIEDEVEKLLGRNAYRPKQLITITAARALIDRNDFQHLVHKPPGRPKLIVVEPGKHHPGGGGTKASEFFSAIGESP